MADSQSLKLAFLTTEVHETITAYVALTLRERGYAAITPSPLEFLGALDCGVNYGSEVARTLKVSGQMVAKTVKELCRAGYLEQVEGVGKQKEILFTMVGEQLMSEVRAVLAQLDETLAGAMPRDSLRDTIADLERMHARIAGRLGDHEHRGALLRPSNRTPDRGSLVDGVQE